MGFISITKDGKLLNIPDFNEVSTVVFSCSLCPYTALYHVQ